MKNQFAIDVDKGLSSEPKYLSSKYFYDKRGDELFIKIMNLPEYYLTNSEMEILSNQSLRIVEKLNLTKNYFEVFELGAGDGVKTIKFLKALKGKEFVYHPIDISENSINQIEDNFEPHRSWLKTKGLVGDYFSMIRKFKTETPKLILFLGSNLGNMDDGTASVFLKQLNDVMNSGDFLLLGLDLIKDSEIIKPAYNDSEGVTAAFNMNLLSRMNRELGATFDLESFEHLPVYDEEKGIAFSYILSTKKQSVKVVELNKNFNFNEGEKIHTEISRKYNDKILSKLLIHTGLKVKEKFIDEKEYFANYLIQKQ